jgi:hypothetical protein
VSRLQQTWACREANGEGDRKSSILIEPVLEMALKFARSLDLARLTFHALEYARVSVNKIKPYSIVTTQTTRWLPESGDMLAPPGFMHLIARGVT